MGASYFGAEGATLGDSNVSGMALPDAARTLSEASGQRIRIEGMLPDVPRWMSLAADFHGHNLLEALWLIREFHPFDVRFDEDEIVLVVR